MTDKEHRQAKLKQHFLGKAIDEYEYSPSPEYDKKRMRSRAFRAGTLDFDYDDPIRDVELSFANGVCDGAWVSARVWVPSKWLESRDSKQPARSKYKKSQ